MGMMGILGVKGGTNILPREGTAWMLMPDGTVYEVEKLRLGGVMVPTANVPIPGEPNAFRVEPSGKPRLSFSGTAVKRDEPATAGLLESLPTPDGKTRFIELNEAHRRRTSRSCRTASA